MEVPALLIVGLLCLLMVLGLLVAEEVPRTCDRPRLCSLCDCPVPAGMVTCPECRTLDEDLS